VSADFKARVYKSIEDLKSIRSGGDEFTHSLSLDENGFGRFSDFVAELSGICYINNDKNRTLFASRFGNILKRYEKNNYDQFLQFARQHPSPELYNEIICCVTTNTTQFFREEAHFDILKDAVEQLRKTDAFKRRPQLRIWCAASSTGQEIYSILFSLLEWGINPQEVSVQLLSTDIDTEVLAQAQEATYGGSELISLPESFRQKYFVALKNGSFQVRKDLRSLVRFAVFNLIGDSCKFREKFDFIFCRNVLIYFDRKQGEGVVRKLGHELRPGGLLFIGHTETIVAKGVKELKSVKPAVYRRESK
jgi:chemotaxis protein methyltransferase CheR